MYLSFIILFITGCSIVPHPAITEYRIDTKNIEFKHKKGDGCISKSLKVAEAFSSSLLMSSDMSYVTDNNKQFTYTQSQWSQSPNHAITSEILNLLRDMKIFKTVQISKSRTRNDLILETSIDEFMQYFINNGKESYVEVRISLTLVDTKTSKAISTKTFSSKVDSISLDAEGGVVALNKALVNVLKQSSNWLMEICI